MVRYSTNSISRPRPSLGGRRGGGWRNKAGALAALAFVFGAAYYLARERGVFDGGTALRPAWFAAVIGAEAALLMIRGVLLRLLCRRLGAFLGRREATALVAWSSLANYVAPVIGGGGLRARYLKRRQRLSYAHSAGIFGGSIALIYAVVSWIGLILLWSWPSFPQPERSWLLALFAVTGGAATFILIWPLPTPSRRSPFGAALNRVVEVWRALDARDLAVLGAWVLCYVASSAASVGSTFAATGYPLAPRGALLVALLAELSIVLQVTPAGIGILETAIASGGSLFQIPVAASLLAGVFRRLGALAVAGIWAASSFPSLQLWKSANNAESRYPTSSSAPPEVRGERKNE